MNILLKAKFSELTVKKYNLKVEGKFIYNHGIINVGVSEIFNNRLKE